MEHADSSIKTIFICAGRGIVVRNILRNDFFKKLRSTPHVRVVIFFPMVKKEVPLPSYLHEEFGGAHVELNAVPNKLFGALRSAWYDLTLNLVFSPTRRLHIRYGTPKVPPKSLLARIELTCIFAPLGRIAWLKRLVRFFDALCFRDREYAPYFDEYKPACVFATSLLSNLDVVFLKEARRRGIPAVAMPKSWDNLDKVLFKVEPDLFLVQNEHMKLDAVRYQGFHEGRIRAVGFPQFDMYKDSSVIAPRDAYCAERGFNPALPILFLGSEGAWSPGDEAHFRFIYEAREKGAIPPCNLLIRPHFSLINEHAYHSFKGLRSVYVDDGYRQSPFFADRWDPTLGDMIDFTNSLHHSAMMITYASTLALDAACFDKPIITIRYGIRREMRGSVMHDMTHLMYETGFYREVVNTGGVTMADSAEEMITAIQRALAVPDERRPEREKLRNKLCFKVDGRTGERLYQEITQCMGVTT